MPISIEDGNILKPYKLPVSFFLVTRSQYAMSEFGIYVRIIDLVSHISHVVCFNFIREWRDLQFNVDSERLIFETHSREDYFLEFLLEVC